MAQQGNTQPYPLTIDQGATRTLVVQYQQRASGVDTPVNLTGYTARMQLRTSYAAASSTLSLTSPSSGIVITPLTGTITVTITATQTAALAAGRYVYDLEIESAGGEVTRVLDGIATVTPEVTR
jgi:hypothetical protein